MTKIPKSFRLSVQAVRALSALVSVTGSNETAIVELALVSLHKELQGHVDKKGQGEKNAREALPT